MTSTDRPAHLGAGPAGRLARWASPDPLARAGAAAWRLLTDVRFAVVLITLLALAGLVGMLVRQFPITAQDDPARYAAELAAMHRAWDGIAPLGLPLGSVLVETFDVLMLFSVFSSPWFLLLMTVLTVSIVCCTLDRTPKLWRDVREVRVAQAAPFFEAGLEHRAVIATPSGVSTPEAVARAFRSNGLRRQRTAEADGATIVYGDRNQYMKLATLLTHAGLVLFLAAGAVTVAAGFETVVFVGEGQTAPVQRVGTPGNLLVKNHGFSAPQRADGSFADFSTDLSVFRDGRELARHTIRVNDPLEVAGFVFHQNTFGPAAELTIHDAAGMLVWDGPLLLADEVLERPRGFMTIPGSAMGLVAVLNQGADGSPQLVLQGIAAAPAVDAADGSSSGTADAPEAAPEAEAATEAVPSAEAAAAPDPAALEAETVFLATLPVGVTTDPEVTAGHAITWQSVGAWSGMVIKNDPGQPVVWLAFALLIAGLVLSFYFPRRRAWARITDGGVALAFLADRYVDRDRELDRLARAVEAVTVGVRGGAGEGMAPKRPGNASRP